MVEPMLSLAMSMQSNKGVYALLLGSGVSRSATIPTGWEVVLDLINQIAHLKGEDCTNNPEAWYIDTYGRQPDYSELLDAVAKTPASRSQLLKSYFEPTEEEKEQGLKIPTTAHKEIARLVVKGYIKVIITTNFDRLLEQALEAEGIVPQVISNANKIKSAFPIVHHPCTIVKVHGDYIEADTKNTVAELEEYDEALNSYLDRIFDEFGLIISGWSAEWDTALRNAIIRCANRRFATYWTDRGRRKVQAQDLINHRRAELIKITDADSFFQELEEKVTSLEEINQNHPLSPKVAVQTLKRYLAEDKYRIRLYDFVMDEVNLVCQQLSSSKFSTQRQSGNIDYGKRIKQYETVTEKLVSILAIGCYHCQPHQEDLWIEAIERIANTRTELGEIKLIALQYYPALLLLYSGGIAALKANNYSLFYSLLTETKNYLGGQDDLLVIDIFNSSKRESFKKIEHLFSNGNIHQFYPDSHSFRHVKTPLNDHLDKLLRESLRAVLPSDIEYQRYFDRFEYLLALVYTDYSVQYNNYPFGLSGCFIWRNHIRQQVNSEVKKYQGNWQPLQAGLFNGSLKRFLEIRESRTEYQVVKIQEY